MELTEIFGMFLQGMAFGALATAFPWLIGSAVDLLWNKVIKRA